jgi:cytochrome c-type biogenesis protein
MLAVAAVSRNVLLRWRQRMLMAGRFGKVAMGVSLLTLGVVILSGADRYVETRLVQASPQWLIDLTTQF